MSEVSLILSNSKCFFNAFVSLVSCVVFSSFLIVYEIHFLFIPVWMSLFKSVCRTPNNLPDDDSVRDGVPNAHVH